MRLNTRYLSNLNSHHSLRRRPPEKKALKKSLLLKSLPLTVVKKVRRRALPSVLKTGNGPFLIADPRTFLNSSCKARVLVLVMRSAQLKSPLLKAQKVPVLMVVQVLLLTSTVT